MTEPRPGRKLAAFAVALLVAFGVGFGLGGVADPIIEPPAHEEPDGHGEHQP